MVLLLKVRLGGRDDIAVDFVLRALRLRRPTWLLRPALLLLLWIGLPLTALTVAASAPASAASAPASPATAFAPIASAVAATTTPAAAATTVAIVLAVPFARRPLA